MDFFRVALREIEKGPKKGQFEVFPDFRIGRSKDLMVRGKHFYAIWDEAVGLWSTDEYDVQRLVDEELDAFAEKREADTGVTHHVKHMGSFGSRSWVQFRQFMQNISDNSHPLDENLVFANTPVKKSDYASKRLPYSLEPGDISAWDELVGTLYNIEERAKIEWAIGAIVSGDSKRLQKFLVFYGPGGTGKSTILNIILKLFEGYTTTFEAKALGSNNGQFATEAFRGNPLVAIQQDGDLSNIQDNTRLNSIISHEVMTMNEKFKPSYDAKVNAILLMGTNQPVKISDAKSGIIRRLIDVNPTGVKIPENHYHTLMNRIDFELGAIAHHCLSVYRLMGKNYYSSYRPTEMMLQTDIFFNFIEANFDIFKEQDGTTLKQAYALYKEFCGETGIERVQPMYKVREELRNYFEDFKDRATIGDEIVRSYYSGFKAQPFKAPTVDVKTFSLVMDDTVSIFDEEYASQPAQYGTPAETPRKKWEYVNTTLADIDTSQLHFVKVPENHIVIDFDIKDESGQKSLERNLEAASAWPPTYAELSKGGAGVHLHYLYPGDVGELSSVHSDGIEIKTLLGDASLRRRLTKCNNVPVATFTGRLPVKEKRVLTEQRIKSERGLRELLIRCLGKEFGAGTKVNVDFMKKILDDAYEDGLQYDVTDMRSRIMVFAMKSTNQKETCLRLVQQMKFKGNDVPAEQLEEPPQETEAKAKDDRIVFFDVEVYPNLFIICWKFRGSKQVVRMVNPKPHEVEALFKFKLVGFYNRRYDNHIIYAAAMGYPPIELFKLSQKIIVDNNINAMFPAAYSLSYADIWDFSSIKQTLKKFMIELGITKIEMDIPWDQPVPEEKIPEVVEYCVNDVEGTEAVFEAREQDFVARQILANLSGLAVNDTTARHTARIIFGQDKNPQSKFEYTPLKQQFVGYDFDHGKSTYRGEVVGEGGYVYAEPGMYENVAVLDVASMHPTSIRLLNLFGDYTPNYNALVEARLAIKAGDYAKARTLLDGKLAPYLKSEDAAEALSYALKIVINIVYGLTAAKFDNAFKDQRNKDNIVAKRGALFMIDLKHAVQEAGYQVVHIKTDSIKIPNATPEVIEDVTNLGKLYGYDFEHEATYSKFCLVNDAVYVAKYGWAAKAKKIGTWEAVGAQFQEPVVFKKLFAPEQEITFDDLAQLKQVSKGVMYLDLQHDTPNPTIDRMQHIGRIGRFVPVAEECGGGILYRYSDDKLYAVGGTKGYLWREAGSAEAMGDKLVIDQSYYDKLVDTAYKTIEKFGDFESFVSDGPIQVQQAA